jgi:4-hydroxy-2-oxoglutarate aldolase
MLTAERLKGVFPPVPTPFAQDGEVAPEKLAENLRKLQTYEVAGEGLAGFVILGSNGEYVYLDEAEKIALFKAARQAIERERLFIAGTGAEATRAVLRLNEAAAVAGADAAIVITPAYYKPAMTVAALVKHFTILAEASPIPLILYNMPSYTGLDMGVETVLELAQHPKIIGLKESSGNIVKIGEIVRATLERKLDFAVLAGSASFLQPTLAVGGYGGVVAAANVAPEMCLAMYQATLRGDFGTAQKMQHNILPLNAAVTTRFGVAGLKYVMDKLNLYGGFVRSPLLPLEAANRASLDELLESYKV